MKENAFRAAVHRHLPKTIHRQPMLAGMMGFSGTPDTYYDFKRDLWVEYKSLGSEDYFPTVLPEDAMPTPLQAKWLDRRWMAGKNAIVLIGFMSKGRAHGLVLHTPDQWNNPVHKDWYVPRIVNAKTIAFYIMERVQ